MNKLKSIIAFFSIGILFGVVMTKSQVISWYRIYEMFRFDSFHMYGIIGVAILMGIVFNQLIKKKNARDIFGTKITFNDKTMSRYRYIIGGMIFGLGWALSGACPGPMYVLVGNGYLVFLIVILSAIAGTFVYGMLRDKLPH